MSAGGGTAALAGGQTSCDGTAARDEEARFVQMGERDAPKRV